MVASEPSDARRWWILTAIGVGTFMSALDGSVVNTILPLLRDDLGASIAHIEWVTAIYLLVVSALLLGVGRAGDLYGHKRIYLAGFVVFVVGSALCGLAPSANALVALRGLQGLGAAMLFANSPAILTRSFAAAQRGRALGAQATFTYLGLTAGPSIGGWLASALGWRWVFYINVPVGIVGIALAIAMIEDDRPTAAAEAFDYVGASLFAGGLVSLMVALNRGHDWGWTSGSILALLLTAVVLIALFIRTELRVAHPMLDLRLFENRIFSASTLAALLNYICLYCVIFVLPFLLIQGRGLDARAAGLVLTAQPIVMAIVAPMSGALSDRIGSRALATIGMLTLAGGMLMLAWSTTAPIASIAASLAVIGLGTGLFVSPNNSALMGAAPRHRQGIASGVMATARNAGMVLGVGISGAVFTSVMARGGSQALQSGVASALTIGAGIALLASIAASRTR